jgi:hypothetical protein
MRVLSASELLGVWERGLAQPPAQRALLLLTLACTDTPPERLAQLTIGQRDVRLLNLRESLFGPQLGGLATCPACGESLELKINVADIRVAPAGEPPEDLTLNQSGYEVHFRLPNSLDLAGLPAEAEVATSRQTILRRCLLSTQHRGKESAAEELPAEVVTAIAERMAQADPQADVQVALRCPQCAHQWLSPLDIVSFFWSEIHAWATRLLHEVHALASAYGWRETDILAMSPWRRRAYLEMINPHE